MSEEQQQTQWVWRQGFGWVERPIEPVEVETDAEQAA